MKQLLLVLGLGLISTGLWAQDTLFWADFSQGMLGWEVNTITCGDKNTGANLGAYELTGGTLQGQDITVLGDEIRFSFLNENEYAVQYRFVNFEATGYSFYEIENDTLKSSMDLAEMSIGLSFSEQATDGIVEWATFVPNGTNLAGVANVLGANDPMITFANGGMEMTLDAGGGTVLNFQKVNDCGDLWVYSPNGNYGYGLFGFAPGGNTSLINSDTRTNGAVVMNAVYQQSLGEAANLPPFPYPQFVTELISPPIDISAADRPVELQFAQAIAYLNTPPNAPATDPNGFNQVRSSFAISTDDGATWTLATDVNPTLNLNLFLRNTVNFPIPIADLNGATEFRVKFTFASDFYFWMLDDIIVKEREDYDMQVNDNWFAIHTNAVTPVSQVENVNFWADIQNNGGLTAEDVSLNLSIENVDTEEEVYNSTNLYGSIIPDSLAENVIFEDQLLAEVQVQGNYVGTYVVSHSNTDFLLSNDTLTFPFVVGDTLFAKEFGQTRSISPAADNSYLYGNIFYVPNGEGMYARHLSFSVFNADEVAASGTGSVTTYLLEWDGDTNEDGFIDPDEYGLTAIGFNDYSFTGSETEDDLITIPINVDGAVPLQNDKYYIPVIHYISSGEDDILRMAASDQFDYGAMDGVSDSLDMPRYGAALALGTDPFPSFFTPGFGSDLVPVVRMSIGNNPDLSGEPIVDVDDPLPVDYRMRVYPNPASERFTLELEMPELVNEATVQLLDPAGRVLFVRQYDGIRSGRFDYDVADLPAGIYLLQLSTEAGSRTERVIIK